MEQEFEKFSLYGFSIEYPKDSRIEFNPKGRRNQGDVVFHFPDRTKIFLSWGQLEDASKRFPTVEEHAANSLKRIRTAGNVKNFERVSHDTIRIHSHKADYNETKFDEVTVGFLPGKKRNPRQAFSFHVHCPETGRFFVVYAMFAESGTYDYAVLFNKMAKSLRCH
jgi:hypothetical protein